MKKEVGQNMRKNLPVAYPILLTLTYSSIATY